MPQGLAGPAQQHNSLPRHNFAESDILTAARSGTSFGERPAFAARGRPARCRAASTAAVFAALLFLLPVSLPALRLLFSRFDCALETRQTRSTDD